jgi:hypothetical protein
MPPSSVARALEEQTLWVTMQALASQGAWTFKPNPAQNVGLGTQLTMDPVDAVQRVCLDCVSATQAHEILQALGAVNLKPSTQSHERAWLLRRLRPDSPLHAQLSDVGLSLPTLVANTDEGLTPINHVLALYLSRAFVAEAQAQVPQRTPVMATFGGEWRSPLLSAEHLALRESIVMEWLSSAGRAPHEILGVDQSASPDHVKAALAAKMHTASAEHLARADLGPVRRCLAVLKDRWTEAAHVMTAN